MRASVGRMIGPGVEAPDAEELTALTGLLRSHIELITPRVEQAALKLPADDVPRYCALACVGEARRKLAATAGRWHGDVVHARKLARSLAALCDHYETLTGVVMCLACDQPVRGGEESLPYGHVSPSGEATGAGRIHTRCANTVRRH
ncbi:DUF6415 family natural product biosynthesis protein [Streptomyces sp. NPDC046805]|uniref:DUF6415 family natural product biosynthesis protein n=1 Tax=Streptomyces sp. NPDC046805 TaxID=3155134 RepID=UPI0033CA8334